MKEAEREQGQFDLMISDIGLPDGSGLHLMGVLIENYHLKVCNLSLAQCRVCMCRTQRDD